MAYNQGGAPGPTRRPVQQQSHASGQQPQYNVYDQQYEPQRSSFEEGDDSRFEGAEYDQGQYNTESII